MPVKFLHTSDWQMGMKALQAGEKAKDVRSVRYETANKVADLAKRSNVDFVLLAGDLFEHNDVDEAVVRKTVAALDAFAPIPVLVLPGNHDPLTPGGVWDRQSWKRVGDHVRLLNEPSEMLISSNVALYPSPLTQKQSALDPTAWIPCRNEKDQRIRIGVAHGALDVLPERGNFPIAAERANQAGLDYLALGDWHGFFQHGKAVYSGTSEQTNFGERDSGNVAIVEVAKAGDEPAISRHRVGKLIWSEYRPSIHDLTDVEQLRSSITGVGLAEMQLIRVLPEIGQDVSVTTLSELSGLREELLAEALFLDWAEESICIPSETPIPIPEGLLARVDSDLNMIFEGKIPDGPGREFASADLNVVREAKSLLRRLAMEGSK